MRGLETVIESATTGDVVAWFPGAIEEIKTHASGHRWVGILAGAPCLFELVKPKVERGSPDVC